MTCFLALGNRCSSERESLDVSVQLVSLDSGLSQNDGFFSANHNALYTLTRQELVVFQGGLCESFVPLVFLVVRPFLPQRHKGQRKKLFDRVQYSAAAQP